MTVTTQGLTGQGLTGIPAQQGTFGPGFGPFTPAPLPSIGPELYGSAPSPFGIAPQLGYPQQQQVGSVLYQPAVQQIAAQVVPIAQQVILPQVLAVAMQHIQQQMPHVIAQLTGQFASQPWQLPWQLGYQSGMGQFGQVRPYAYS